MKLKGLKELKDIVKIIEDSENIVIISHEGPDGDSIGSALALYNYLKEYFTHKNIFKSIQVVLRDVPERYSILKSYDEIKEEIDETEEIDLLIVLDLNDVQRIGELKYLLNQAKQVLVIDHHVGEPNFGDYKIFQENSAATSLIFYEMYNEIKLSIDLPNPSKSVVEAVLVGVIADTSGFKNTNTNKEVFEFVAKAMCYDINISEIYFEILGNKTQNELALKALVLNRLEYFLEGRIAFSYLLFSDDEYKNREPGEHEGLSGDLRDIQGVDIAILIREVKDGLKASLRSKKGFDCKKIVEEFGGGGHLNAAGVLFKKRNLDEVKKEIVEKTIEVLKEY